MERPQRDFKGIWIPKEIWLSHELSLLEKVIFVEIHSLDNERGCFASNAYFADFFKISVRYVQKSIASLKDKGFVTVAIKDRTQRTIRVTTKFNYPNAQARRRLRGDIDDLTDRFSIHRGKR